MINRITETLQKHLDPGHYIYGFGDLTGLLAPVYSHVIHVKCGKCVMVCPIGKRH